MLQGGQSVGFDSNLTDRNLVYISKNSQNLKHQARYSPHFLVLFVSPCISEFLKLE